MLNWLKKLFQKSKSFEKSQPVEEQASEESSENLIDRDENDLSYEATYKAIDAYWSKIGKVDSDVIAYMINPMFMGAPAWPSGRRAFKIIRTDNSLIIASDGLCDPFSDSNELLNGYELEVFIEVKGAQNLSFDEIKSSPAFAVIEQTAMQIPIWGSIAKSIKDLGFVSSEIYIEETDVPAIFDTGRESIGILFGIPVAHVPRVVPNTPLSEVQMIPVTILTAAEVAQAAIGGEERRNVARLLSDSEYKHYSDFNRQSVI